jgi:hypothetical protein
MIAPGEVPGVPQDKRAVTRFANNQIEAKQRGMTSAAQQSLRRQTGEKPRQPREVPQQTALPARRLPSFQQTAIPTEGPALPDAQLQDFDPEVFKADYEDNLVEQIRLEQFMNSEPVKDAQTSIMLKEAFNQNNENRKPDPRNLLDRVLSRLGSGK